ncbi:MAG TPA: OsmC family protein [Nitrososphaerales archaeon]|nr:OsmC family protein [Nitrososphaerales archaeon]HUK74909.1 OsmC family protein [Nitrososphaerales archaeon]
MTTKAQSAQIQNGVNVDQLVGTVNAIKGTPSLAKFSFRSASRWGGGAKSTAYMKSFYGAGQEDSSRTEAFSMEGDEPPVLLGTNTAPNAVEALLSALAGCMTVAFIYPASAQGVRVESLEYEIDGDVDLQGFLQLSDKIRPGLQSIRVRAHVKADAPREKIQELLEHAAKTSVVMDTIRNPVPVRVELA